MARATMTAFLELNNLKALRFAHTSTSQVFSFQTVSFPLRKLGRL